MATSAVAQTFCSFVSQAVGIGIQDEKWKRISPAATEEDVATNLSFSLSRLFFSLARRAISSLSLGYTFKLSNSQIFEFFKFRIFLRKIRY